MTREVPPSLAAGAVAVYRSRVMSPRIRKLIGVVAFVVYLGVYLLVAMAVGARHVNTAHGLIQLAYYVAAGLAWLPGAMALIRWMSRPPASGDADRA